MKCLPKSLPGAGILLMLCLVVSSVEAALQGREVAYSADGVTLKGYLAYDDAIQGRRPGVLVVHEWWGLNTYARKRAEMLARKGYIALAVDMYGEGRQAGHPREAEAFAARLSRDRALTRARFEAARALLAAQDQTDPQRLAAIGYCFGGGVVLEMARAGVELQGVVSFHGPLTTRNPARPGEVRARVLVFNGGADPYVTRAQVRAFKAEMEQAGVDYRVIEYPQARHSFTNPEANILGERFQLPLAYDRKADRSSWEAMLSFFQDIFASPAP
ncbi:MAG TPA: dienelactone hydrolase family protein [Gammaproteobacteria bacterium]|nr:dienelactone hydrolase family protein [Gammaproteobacteria bacterium]